jgi:hypothetical protein
MLETIRIQVLDRLPRNEISEGMSMNRSSHQTECVEKARKKDRKKQRKKERTKERKKRNKERKKT